MDKFFEHQKRLQNLINQQSKILDLAGIGNQIASITQNAEAIAQIFSERSSAMKLASSPVLEAIENQNQLIDHMNNIGNQNITNIQKWHSSIEHLVKSQSLNLTDAIPDSLFNSLIDLTSEVEKAPNYQSEDSDLLTEITVADPSQTDNTLSKNTITWELYVMIIPMIFALILHLQTSYADQNRHEEEMDLKQIHHEEKMAEERKQTKLLERSIEIQEQDMIDNQSQTTNNKIMEEQYEIINEKIDLLIKESLKSITEAPTDQVDPVEDSSD